MKKLLITAGLSLVLAAPAFAGSRHAHDRNHDYNLFVVADENTDSAIFVITHDGETVAIEVFDDDEDARWLKDKVGLNVLAQAEDEFGPIGEGKGKGFAFSINDDEVHIAFPLLFFKHISIRASDDEDEAPRAMRKKMKKELEL